MCLYFFTPLPSATVLRLVFVSLAILFSLITVLLPVDCWIPRIHHLSRCQGSTCAASGCHCAELERGSECPGCGRRTDVLCCGWLLPGVARVFPAWYVPFGMTLKTLVIRPSFFFFILNSHDGHCAGTKVCLSFRNWCIRSGSSAVFTHFPHQPLRNLPLFTLQPFPVSDPAGGGGKLLHVPLSFPKERSKSWRSGSSCGGLRCLNHTDGDTGHQNTPYADTAREFILHVIWYIAGIAGFQCDAAN